MPLLEAFLALALTLLSLAMIATLIVEMIHRIAGTRSENLKTMLGELYERETRDRDPKEMIESLLKQSGEELDDQSKANKFVEELLKKGSEELKKNEIKLREMVEKLLKEGSERLDDAQSKLKDDVEAELKNDFIDDLIGNPLKKRKPVKKGKPGGHFKELLNFSAGILDSMRLRGLKNRKNLASISTEELFEKLAYTDVGKQIKAKAEEEIDQKVDQLARSYDEIGVAATDLFRRKAQVISLLVGVLVAFAFNANAPSILEAYLDNPQARAKAVARADAVLENFTKMTDTGTSADATPSGDTKPDADAKPGAVSKPGADAKPDADTKPNTDNTQGYKTYEEFVENVNSVRAEIKKLGNMGIPLGYSKDKAPKSWPDDSIFPDYLQFVFWVLGVFGTGLLIGLGGPFWFNVVRKLTDVLQVVRGGAPAAAGPSDSATGRADPVKSNRDAFKMTGGLPPAAKAQAKLTAATKVAADANRGVNQAEDALKNATDEQKKAHELKKKAEPSVPEAD